MKKFIQFTIFILLFSGINNLLPAQSGELPENNKFLISVKIENDFVTITNIEGCNFISIGFRLVEDDKPIGFNESGMFDLGRRQKRKKSNKNAMFSFSVKRNEKGLLLESIDGVEWKELVLNINEKNDAPEYFVSQSGLKDNNLE